MSSLRSSLARLAPAMRDPTPDGQLAEWRRAAWLGHGVAVLRLCDLTDEWELATVTNIATRMYGKRIPT